MRSRITTGLDIIGVGLVGTGLVLALGVAGALVVAGGAALLASWAVSR